MRKTLAIFAIVALVTVSGIMGWHFEKIGAVHKNTEVQIFGVMYGESTLNLHNAVMEMLASGQTVLEIFIMSGGGNAYDFSGAVDVIKFAQSRGIYVITRAYGLVMSAAVPVFAAGDLRIAGPNVQFMLHHIDTRGYVLSEDDIECITMLTDFYIKHMAAHSSLTEDEIDQLMIEVTFFTAQQAQRWGIVDVII